jgi:hypothetical protein
MTFYHGVQTSQKETSVSTPNTADSGIPFIVGTAPVHTVGGKVNEPVLCNTYSEAVSAFGYSDDWQKYTICEMIYSHFKLFGMSPLIVVNVLDPAKHKKSIAATSVNLVDGQATLPYEAIADSVKVTGANGSTTYVAGTDYDVFFDDDKLIVEIIDGGAITTDTTSLEIGYDAIDTSVITKKDIIGGFDVNTKTYSGFELVDQVFPKYLTVPDLLLAPGWSSDSEVAAVMAAKAASINGLFPCKALIDADCSTVLYYSDVPAWKSQKNIVGTNQIVCWPMVKLGDRMFHLSVQVAGDIAKVDTDNNGCPSESPSNKSLQMDSLVLADGTEVTLDLTQANYLNANGIVTALNFIGGFVLWGNCTACYPSNTDVKDYFIAVSRTFDWVAKTLVLSFWSKTDKKMNRVLIDSITNSVNIWLAGLVAEGNLLGGRVEVLDDENPLTDLLSGIIRFHIYIAPPVPAQEIDFTFEYDASYVQSALTA